MIFSAPAGWLRRTATSALIFAATALATAQSATVAQVTDLWDGILRDHVRPGVISGVELNVVDYRAIAKDPRWPQVLTALETAPVPTGKAAQIAYWSNAYNILAIRTVLKNYPVKSIRDGGSLLQAVWDKEAGVAGGKMRTLNEIEHQILRPLGDSRIHAAIVCASVSCPPLRPEAFRPETLNKQLDEQVRHWLANPKVGLQVSADGKTLTVSSLFKWFGADFVKDAGSVRKFIDKYGPERELSRAAANARIVYLDYDWSLNDSRRSK